MGTSEGRNEAGSMKPWPGQSSRETEPRLGRSRRETVLYACLDMKSIILGKHHYMIYVLVLAMRPKMLMTVDENLKLLSVPVRVGQAVDVVGQAGQPKTIMGFQTHSTLTSSWRPS